MKYAIRIREPLFSDGAFDVCSLVEISVEFSPLCADLSEEVDEAEVLLSAELFPLLSELPF